jgi:hypothetical protein
MPLQQKRHRENCLYLMPLGITESLPKPTLLAVAGSGIALASPAFVSEDMKSGRFFDVMAKSGLEYFLVYSETRHNSPKIRAFREWILAEAGRMLTAILAALPFAAPPSSGQNPHRV